MGRRFDATTGRATDAGVKSHGFRFRGAAVGEQRRHDCKVRSGLAVHIVCAPSAPLTAPGTRGRRDTHDMHDLRGQGDRPALRHHHVRRVSNRSLLLRTSMRLNIIDLSATRGSQRTIEIFSHIPLYISRCIIYIQFFFILRNFIFIKSFLTHAKLL